MRFSFWLQRSGVVQFVSEKADDQEGYHCFVVSMLVENMTLYIGRL